jgi:hypothetical protein
MVIWGAYLAWHAYEHILHRKHIEKRKKKNYSTYIDGIGVSSPHPSHM